MSKVVKNDSFSSRSGRPDGGSFALILEALSTTCLSSTHDDLAQRLQYTFAADQRDDCPEVLVASATALRATQRVAVTLNELKGLRNSGCRARHAAVAPHRFCAPALTEPVGLPHGKAGRLFLCPAVSSRSSNRADGGLRPIERPPDLSHCRNSRHPSRSRKPGVRRIHKRILRIHRRKIRHYLAFLRFRPESRLESSPRADASGSAACSSPNSRRARGGPGEFLDRRRANRLRARTR